MRVSPQRLPRPDRGPPASRSNRRPLTRRDNVTSSPDRKAQILASSAALFAEKGVGATTVREIGDAAGVFSGSLYHYFKSKNDIVVDLLGIYVADIEARFNRIETIASTPEDVIKGLIHETLAVIDEHPHSTAIYQNDQNYLRDKGLLESVDNAAHGFREHWITALRQGVEQGVFRDDVKLEVFYRIIRETLWSTNRWPDRSEYSLSEISDLMTTLFLDGFHATDRA